LQEPIKKSQERIVNNEFSKFYKSATLQLYDFTTLQFHEFRNIS